MAGRFLFQCIVDLDFTFLIAVEYALRTYFSVSHESPFLQNHAQNIGMRGKTLKKPPIRERAARRADRSGLKRLSRR